jgi:multidrug resistance protein, MATE family
MTAINMESISSDLIVFFALPMKLSHLFKADFKANLRLAWPIIIGQLGQISVNLIDNVMVGQLGTVPLGSISLAISIFIIFFVVGMGLSVALQPLVAEADARGEAQICSFSFKHSFLINTIFSLISIALVEIGIELIHSLGQNPEVVHGAIPYLRISMYSLIPFMWFQAFKGLSEGLSETRAPMIAMVIGNAANIILNYMLIFGHWGAPDMGLKGAAYATFISRVLMFFLLILLMRYWKKDSAKRLWDYILNVDPWHYSMEYFRKVLRLGIPSSLQMLFEVGAFAAAAIMMGMLGPIEQAAHQITITAVSTTFMICLGISVAATVRVGNALGKDDKKGMRNAGAVALLQVVLFMSVTAISIALLRFVIPTWFIDDEAVIEIAAILLVVSAVFQISDGLQVAAIGALRGMQDIWWPTMITFFAYSVVGIPFSYFAAFHWGLDYVGIWLGLLLGLSLSAILNTWRFYRLTA